MRAVEAQREAHDDPFRLAAAGNLYKPDGQGLLGLGRHRLQRLGDGLGGVAQGEADTLRPGIDGEDPHRWRYGDGDAFGEGDAVAPVAEGGAAPDSTT